MIFSFPPLISHNETCISLSSLQYSKHGTQCFKKHILLQNIIHGTFLLCRLRNVIEFPLILCALDASIPLKESLWNTFCCPCTFELIFNLRRIKPIQNISLPQRHESRKAYNIGTILFFNSRLPRLFSLQNSLRSRRGHWSEQKKMWVEVG